MGKKKEERKIEYYWIEARRIQEAFKLKRTTLYYKMETAGYEFENRQDGKRSVKFYKVDQDFYDVMIKKEKENSLNFTGSNSTESNLQSQKNTKLKNDENTDVELENKQSQKVTETKGENTESNQADNNNDIKDIDCGYDTTESNLQSQKNDVKTHVIENFNNSTVEDCEKQAIEANIEQSQKVTESNLQSQKVTESNLQSQKVTESNLQSQKIEREKLTKEEKLKLDLLNQIAKPEEQKAIEKLESEMPYVEDDEPTHFISKRKAKVTPEDYGYPRHWDDDGFWDLPPYEQFQICMTKKTLGKKGDNRRATICYWKKLYNKARNKKAFIKELVRVCEAGTGRIHSGPKSEIPQDVEDAFIELVKKSVLSPRDSLDYVPQCFRKMGYYQDKLRIQLKKDVKVTWLYKIVDKYDLRKKYLDQKDETSEKKKSVYHFKDREPYELIQMDGVELDHIKILNPNGSYGKPEVIGIYDTGSRFMFSYGLAWSETNEACTDVFCEFLRKTAFPNQKVNFRPDNAPGFTNLKNILNAINLKHKVSETTFWINADYARAYHPKDKVHLERWNSWFHSQEHKIAEHYMEKGLVEGGTFKMETVKKGSKLVDIPVYYINTTLEELWETGLIQGIIEDKNNTEGKYTKNGKTGNFWIPAIKAQDYIAEQPTVKIKNEDIEEYYAYGYPKAGSRVVKYNEDVIPVIHYDGRDYFIQQEPGGYPVNEKQKVTISPVRNKLYLFDDNTGILLGTAIATLSGEVALEKSRKYKLEAKEKTRQTDIEKIFQIFALNEIPLNETDQKAVMKWHDGGKGVLTVQFTKDLIENQKDRYLGIPPERRYFAVFNDLMEAINRGIKVKPYEFAKEVRG